MSLNNRICPICGQPNGCQHDQAEDTGIKCWCTELKISPKVFDQIPVEARGKACVCQSCIDKYK